jgi:hypothetical protein
LGEVKAVLLKVVQVVQVAAAFVILALVLHLILSGVLVHRVKELKVVRVQVRAIHQVLAVVALLQQEQMRPMALVRLEVQVHLHFHLGVLLLH